MTTNPRNICSGLFSSVGLVFLFAAAIVAYPSTAEAFGHKACGSVACWKGNCTGSAGCTGTCEGRDCKNTCGCGGDPINNLCYCT